MQILQKAILLLVGVTLLVTIFALVWFKDVSQLHYSLGKIIDKVTVSKEVGDSMVFVGDIMLARDVERKMERFGSDFPWRGTKEFFEGKVVVGNFEASIPEQHIPTPDFAMKFSVHTDNLVGLADSGITHLSLANNHSFDYAGSAYENTMRQLRSHGVTAFGHPGHSYTNSIKYVTLDDKEIALMAINTTHSYPTPERWQSAIVEMTSQSDLQVVYVHWGEEYQLIHNEQQSEFAHSLIDQGVDLVVGHHPHVVQDVERYEDGLIFYSLGNFIFDQYFDDSVQEGLILELKRERGQWLVELMPIESKTVRVQPRHMVGQEREAFLADLVGRSGPDLTDEIWSTVLEIH